MRAHCCRDIDLDRVAAGMSWRKIRSVALVYVVVAAVLVGLNVGFIFLEESPHASGSAKHAAVVFFALLHELVDHIMVPLIVSAMALTTGTHTRPTPVFVAAVVIEVTNSVISPVIAQLIASEGCFRDQLFSSPTAVSASVTVAFCGNTSYTTESACNLNGWPWNSYPVGVSYTPPFQFDGSRCLSSIITLYTPEYLVIFAIRMLFYPFAWWLARRGTPWVVAGLQPPVLLASAFVNGRNRLLCKPSAATDGAVRADGVVEILHSIEPATHCFNLLVIAVCPGLFAPVIAVAALVTLGCRHVVFWALDSKIPPPESPKHAVHALPVACVGIMLAIESIYLMVILAVTGLGWAGYSIVVLNWIALTVAVLWRHSKQAAQRSDLTEMLLTPGDFDQNPS